MFEANPEFSVNELFSCLQNSCILLHCAWTIWCQWPLNCSNPAPGIYYPSDSPLYRDLIRQTADHVSTEALTSLVQGFLDVGFTTMVGPCMGCSRSGPRAVSDRAVWTKDIGLFGLP